jgi:putative permease
MALSFASSQLNFVQKRLRYFLPNSQAATLAINLTVGFLLVYALSNLLMPVFASIVLAYLLNGLVEKAERRQMPHWAAVYMVFSTFVAGLSFALFILMPIVSEQAVQLVQHIPEMVKSAQTHIMHLPEKYPQIITESRIKLLMLSIQNELLNYGQKIISGGAASVVGLVSAMVYLFLVPLMVFFFLKDKAIIINWMLQFMPKDQNLTRRVWQEVDIQLGNYVRGKFIEVFILWFVSYVTYSAIGLNYAMLLAVFMGISVIIPYVGATLVTFPQCLVLLIFNGD